MTSPKSVQGLLGARRCHGICLSFPEAGLSRRGPAKASHHARLVATLPRECQLLSGSRAVDPGEEEQGAGTGFRRTAPSLGWLSAPERSLPVDVSLRARHGAGGHTRSFLGSLAPCLCPCSLSTLCADYWGCTEGVNTHIGLTLVELIC